MAKKVKVYSSPEEYRRAMLQPEHFHEEVKASFFTRVPFIVNGPMGVGKTHGLLAYLRSGVWRMFCAGVILFFYTHRQLTEIEEALSGSGLVIRRWPQRDRERCGDNDVHMTYYEERGLPHLAKVDVCQKCPAEAGCPYIERSKEKWVKGAHVILAPEQLVQVFPEIIDRWADTLNGDSGSDKPLLIAFDEVKVADSGFYRTFTKEELFQESIAALACRFYDIVYFLDALMRQPGDPRSLTAPALDPKDRIRLQRRGVKECSEAYRPVLELAEAYVLNPIWHEDGVYCIEKFPELPATTIFLGAFLDPTYIAWRMRVPTPRVMGDGSLVLHPESQILNIASALGFRRYWSSNRASIINFAADLIAKNCTERKTTIVVGRKNPETDAT